MKLANDSGAAYAHTPTTSMIAPHRMMAAAATGCRSGLATSVCAVMAATLGSPMGRRIRQVTGSRCDPRRRPVPQPGGLAPHDGRGCELRDPGEQRVGEPAG